MAKTMRRKYICTNGVVEVTQFTVGDKTENAPKWHRAKSQDDKRDENARQAVRVAARILNCNYTPEDYLVELTYSHESMEKVLGVATPQSAALTAPLAQGSLGADEIWDNARMVLAKKLEQVRRAAKKAGVEVKTFSVTSDLDQETGEVVRVHHHVVINAEGLELLKEKWNYGLVLEKNLYRQDDYTPLAAYLLGQVRHVENRKKYSCSRNMVQPKVEEMVLAEEPSNEIRVQPGARVLDRTPYREGCVSQYVRYKRKPATRKRGGKKLGTGCGGGNDVEIATSPLAPADTQREWRRQTTPEDAGPRNDKIDGADVCGGSEFCSNNAEGGSDYEFSEITWG